MEPSRPILFGFYNAQSSKYLRTKPADTLLISDECGNHQHTSLFFGIFRRINTFLWRFEYSPQCFSATFSACVSKSPQVEGGPFTGTQHRSAGFSALLSAPKCSKAFRLFSSVFFSYFFGMCQQVSTSRKRVVDLTRHRSAGFSGVFTVAQHHVAAFGAALQIATRQPRGSRQNLCKLLYRNISVCGFVGLSS